MKNLEIAGKSFESRLIMGSARFPDPQTMVASIRESRADMVTVAIRRTDLNSSEGDTIMKYLRDEECVVLPNTAGCYTAREAVLTARLAREALGTSWVKLEVIGDDETLMPDVPELLKAAEELIMDGFTVLPYTNSDPITARKLAGMGCAAVMPLGSPIGSGLGIQNRYNLQLIRQQLEVPVILDAGVGTASDAAVAMEMGMDAVLLNTAVSQAEHPVGMARAMRLAVEAGRTAYESGRIPQRFYAEASSPTRGTIQTGGDD